MTQELVLSDQTYMPAMSVPQAVMRFNTLVEFVQTVMRQDVDYGIIPGTPKPTLLKAGAEKLTTLFGLTTRFSIVEKAEDWSGEQHGGEPFFYYWYRCSLWRGERLIAEADGSCNSRESKYRWRWVGAQDIPAGLNPASLPKRGGSISEFEFAIDKGETGGQYGKPAAYWQAFRDGIEAGTARKTVKKTKAGKEMPAWEIDTTMYRVPNEDIASQVNTVQKMAQKRAFVAVTLIGVNASEFFTQDVEDMDLIGNGASYTPPVQVIDAPAVESPPPSPPAADDLAQLAEAVKKLREAERQVAAEPPAFTWNKKQGKAALEAERQASRGRLYDWLTSKAQGFPPLDELDDVNLVDVVLTTAGL